MLAELERDYLRVKLRACSKVKWDRRVLTPMMWDTFRHLPHSFIVKLNFGIELLIGWRIRLLEFSNKNKFTLASLLHSLSRLG